MSNNNKKQWVNVTKEFIAAVKEMNVGELQHVFLFGLFEAMSAIEMMDPKMDSGIKRLEEHLPLTFERAIDQGLVKPKSVPLNEVLGIMDGLYSCFVSWLEGNSLAQTVFTCLYLHKPTKLDDEVMRVFSVAFLKLISSVIDVVTAVKAFEEEDFQTSTYGYDLCEEFSISSIQKSLKEKEEEFTNHPKNENELETADAIAYRLKLTRILLEIFYTLRPTFKTTTKEEDIDELLLLLNALTELLPRIQQTVPLGAPPDTDAPCVTGFSPLVNQRLLPPTFPRFTKFKDRLSCHIYLENLTQRIKLACNIIHCKSYKNVMDFFLSFSKTSDSCLVSRSVLQRLYFRDFPNSDKAYGLISFDSILKNALIEFVSPVILQPDHPLYTDQVAQGCVQSFIIFNQAPFSFLLEIYGFNPARQRDKLAKLLESFDNIQEEAERIDNFLYKKLCSKADCAEQNVAGFSTWILYYTLRLQILYIYSGFELELYSVHELIYMYYYLYEYLFAWQVSTLTRAESYLELAANIKTIKKGKTRKRQKLRYHSDEIMYTQALQNLCGGYLHCLVSFIKEKRVPQPLPMFNDEKVRYEHRFAPFSCLTSPPHRTYLDFKRVEHQLLKSSTSELYLNAARFFEQAKNILDHYPHKDSETTNLLRVAKFNYVSTNLLANGHKKNSKSLPQFDFTIHKCYPLIKQY